MMGYTRRVYDCYGVKLTTRMIAEVVGTGNKPNKTGDIIDGKYNKDAVAYLQIHGINNREALIKRLAKIERESNEEISSIDMRGGLKAINVLIDALSDGNLMFVLDDDTQNIADDLLRRATRQRFERFNELVDWNMMAYK